MNKNFTKLNLILFLFCCGVLAYAQPANDLCAGATPITPSAQGTGCASATFTLPFSTDGTTDSGVPTVCSTPGLDQWFTWTATSLGLSFTSSSPGDPGIAIFANCTDVASGTDIVCLGTFGTGNLSGWTMGQSLIIQIYDFSGSTSDVGFCLEEYTPAAPPANNDCANATPVGVNADLLCTVTESGTIESATASGEDETTCSGTEDDDVWFSFVATATSHEIDLINVINGTTDLYHSVWSGYCGALTNILCSDPNSSTASGLTIGNTYLLRVYSYTSTGGQTTDFDVCIGTLPPPPANDVCSGASPVAMSSTTLANTGASTNAEALAPCSSGGGGSPGCAAGAGIIDFGAGLWYVYTSTAANEVITVSTDNPGTDFDTEIQVFRGACGSLTCVGGDDDSGSVNLGSSSIFCFVTEASVAPVDYYIYIDGHGTNSGNFEMTLNSVVVPVELVSFEGTVMENENKITWSTATEENTQLHIVERSERGNEWQEIESIEAAGFSNVLNSYEAMDSKPLDVAYYRLKSLDYDGQFQYSDIIKIRRGKDGSYIDNVFPNPASTSISVNYSSVIDENVDVSIYNINGQLVQSINALNMRKGMNTNSIEIADLNAGIYVLQIKNSTETKMIRFVKE